MTFHRTTDGALVLIADGPAFIAEHPASPRRLNAAFAAWLMGWPPTWVQAEPRSCDSSETALWRARLQQHLSSLLDEPEC